MKILLDTQIILWFHTEDPALPKETKEFIENSEVYYSAASTWEVAIKHLIKPSDMPLSEEEFIAYSNKSNMMELPIFSKHTTMIKTLKRSENAPEHHDPFDRLLIAQAKSEGLMFLTADEKLPQYNEPCVVYVKKKS